MAVKLNNAMVRKARVEAGLYQSSMAEAAGVSTTTAWSAEHGKKVSLFVAKSICETLGIDLVDTIVWADEVVNEETIAACQGRKMLTLSRLHKVAEDLGIVEAGDGKPKPVDDSAAFNVDDEVVVYVSLGVMSREMREGKIIAKHKKFALIDLGHYRESFAYADIEKAEEEGRRVV